MTPSEQERTEASINQKTTISLWLVCTLVAGAIAATLWQYNERDEVLKEVRELRSEIRESNSQNERRLNSMEDVTSLLKSNTWTIAMQEIWVLRSRESGELADPAPIIERHMD